MIARYTRRELGDAWSDFARFDAMRDPVAAGQEIGTRHDGSAVVAPFDGYIVFPNVAAESGHEWFYLARPSSRLTRDVLPERLVEQAPDRVRADFGTLGAISFQFI